VNAFGIDRTTSGDPAGHPPSKVLAAGKSAVFPSGAAIHPMSNGVDVILTEGPLHEVAAARRRLPWRHLMRLGHELDGVGVQDRVLIRHQRKGRDVVRVMTRLAVCRGCARSPIERRTIRPAGAMPRTEKGMTSREEKGCFAHE
jgi:hypothetical protein